MCLHTVFGKRAAYKTSTVERVVMTEELSEAMEHVHASLALNIQRPAAPRSKPGSANEKRASEADKWLSGQLSRAYMFREKIDNVSEDFKACLGTPLA